MGKARYSVAVAAAFSTLLGLAGLPPHAGFVPSATAQSIAPFGLTQRPTLAPLNLPFEGDDPGGAVRIVRAFPNLSFANPLFITAAPGSDAHLFVIEQIGIIRRFANAPGTTSAPIFLDLRSIVADRGVEEGLLGLTFHPDYASNGYFYVYFSPKDGSRRTQLSRFRRNGSNPAIADLSSRLDLLTIAQPFANHNGGSLQFGPDGKLYVASGDGGSADDPNNNAQNLGSLLGKLLRLNDDGSVPGDNPFVGTVGARPEIWALGLRNPWRFGIDRATGSIWLGDVGQNRFEEVNLIRRGGNYGWRVYEGGASHINPNNVPASAFDPPVFTYAHESADPLAVTGASITGGYVYRGSRVPALAGKYVFADFVDGRVWALRQQSGAVSGVEALGSVNLPASFGEDNAGNLYLLSLGGTVHTFEGEASGGGTAPAKLSETGLFTGTSSLQPNPGLIEYEINAPFWSDGTEKRRWVALPDGGRIGFTSSGAWSWPDRAVVVKHFEIMLASGVRTRLETRVLVNTAQGWRGYTYRWNAAQTDADLLPDARTTADLQVMDATSPTGSRAQTYVFPSRSDCLQCHTQVSGVILGARTGQMNRDHRYPNGITDNQLRAFNNIALFDRDIGSPTQYSRVTDPADTNATLRNRARAYLDSNCAQCHQPGGPTPVPFDLRITASDSAMQAIGVRPGSGSLGLSDAFIIAPGNKSRSVLWERLRRLDDTRMPPLGSHRVDDAGVALIGQWIDSLPTTLPSVSIAAATGTVSESAGKAHMSIRLSAPSSQTVTIPVSFGGTATRASTGDYTAATTAISIAAGSTTGSRTITLVNDVLDEDTETVILTLRTPTNATLGSITQHTLSITDNDATPTVAFSSASRTVSESVGTVIVRVNLSAISGRSVSVPFSFSGTALRPDDYTASTSNLLIPAGSSGADLRLSVINDTRKEATETAIVTIGTPTNAGKGSTIKHTMSISASD